MTGSEPSNDAAVGSARAQHYEMDMKKVIAYVNTVRVHWLVEVLETTGIKEILVTEYFSPLSKISRCEFLCDDKRVDQVRDIVHRIGTSGNLMDHCFLVEDFDPDLPSQIPLGKRVSKLEESRIKQLINVLLSGMGKRISLSFFAITFSIILAGLFIHMRMTTLDTFMRDSNAVVWQITGATREIQRAMLQEMLAAEQFHRGETADARRNFDDARRTLGDAVLLLKGTAIAGGDLLDSLLTLHQRFQATANGMFGVPETPSHPSRNGGRETSTYHPQLMASLNQLHLQLMGVMLALERVVGDRSVEKEVQTGEAISEVRNSLIALAALAVLLSGVMWFWTERKVTQPLKVVVDAARIIDKGELK